MEQLYLDPESVDLTGDKDYTSIDELREDLLDLPVFLDFVSSRIPRQLFSRDKFKLMYIDIQVAAAAQHITSARIKSIMNCWWGSL